MRAALGACVLTWALACGGALRADGLDALFTALRMSETLETLRDEGVGDAESILPKTSDGVIADLHLQQVEAAFDLALMERDMRDALEEYLDPEMTIRAVEFFESDVGQSLISLELSARRAIMDEEIESLAMATWEKRAAENDPHIIAIRKFVRVNDLVNLNAAGTMVARYEYMHGLATGSGTPIDEDALLADIWDSEDSIVEETESWLTAYLLLAYGSVPTSDIDAYTAFSREASGQALNFAIFHGFETSYRRISFELGRISGHAAAAGDL